MISAWLVRSGLFSQAQESLAYFRDRRTDTSRGKKMQGPNSQHAGIFTTLLDRNPGCPISPAEVTTWYLPCPPNVSVLALVLVSSLTCWPEVLSFMTIALSLHWIFPSLILQ